MFKKLKGESPDINTFSFFNTLKKRLTRYKSSKYFSILLTILSASFIRNISLFTN